MEEGWVMIGKMSDTALDFLISGITKKIEEIKKDNKWEKLFINTGEFLINSSETSTSFRGDLIAIFSKENLKDIAKKLKNDNGYDFLQSLNNELYDLMISYEVSTTQAETYIHYFSQMIITYLEENDSDKILEIYLGEWRREEAERFDKIEKGIRLIIEKMSSCMEKKISYFSIRDIDAQIRKRASYTGLSLDFFELDDEQFELCFQENINKNRVFVVGKSREETTYRILNELYKKNSDRVVIVIKSQNEWEKLENSDVTGCILIPFFYAEKISTIPNNTNIFVYGKDEPCYSKDRLELRKRTRKNIIDSLEKIGIESSEAHRIVEKTHGLYSALKKKLSNDVTHNVPEWVKRHSDVVMAALLCGKWTESEGDKIVFEELSGKKYDDCKKELLNYTHGETPYLVQITDYSGSNMQLASVEDAWEELDTYISDDMWDKFIKLFYEVLIVSEPIFDYPFEKHFEASIYASKPDWSQILKRGMIRTLVMRAYYRQHAENQFQIDKIVERVLKTITTKERWGYISQYFTELCEASPKAVIEKLEKEISTPTGMLELFAANGGDFLTGRHYYTHVLWAVEQLLQQKIYVKRAVDWLWKMNEYDIKYNISNSPKSVLELVFCAWLNVSVLSVESKIDLAKKAVETYSNAWDIVYACLPKGNGAICSTLNTTHYRSVDEPQELYVHEVNKTYVEYLKMCVENIKGDVERWKKIIGSLHMYGDDLQADALNRLVEDCHTFSDLNKIKIKNELRYLIYRHRYFANAEWSMQDECVQRYEDALNKIVLANKTYDFLYLFTSEYDFPLMNPIPFHKEEKTLASRDENKKLRDKELTIQFKLFKENNYSLPMLIDAALEGENCVLGEALAQYYCDSIFDRETFDLLLKKDIGGKQIFGYVRSLYYDGKIDLKEIVNIVKENTNNQILIANLIALEKITDCKDAIIATESEEIKKEYWGRHLRAILPENADEEVWLWALEECRQYGTIASYIELLFDAKGKISTKQLLESVLEIEGVSGNAVSMTDYYLTETLSILQKEYMDDLVICKKIALLEWRFSKVLEWENMKCFQNIIKFDPALYAKLVNIMYKSEDGKEASEDAKQLANSLYESFDKARFCPTEANGEVKYDEIKDWVDKFKNLLIEQKQGSLFGHLIGRLLAFSPIGSDGYMPCESVRKIIEEYFNDDLKNEYAVTEENKRGVHTVDAGKSELILSEKYEENAKKLCDRYPRTAEIYYMISDSYKRQAENERRRAEDVF